MSEVIKLSKDTRFKKGQSGNPKGRPRKPRPTGPLALLEAQLDQKVSIQSGQGPRKKMTSPCGDHADGGG